MENLKILRKVTIFVMNYFVNHEKATERKQRKKRANGERSSANAWNRPGFGKQI